jgi:hypothetical protein
MLAKRWCGREAILMDVRRAAEDMMWRCRMQVEVDSREEQEERAMLAGGKTEDGNNGYPWLSHGGGVPQGACGGLELTSGNVE